MQTSKWFGLTGVWGRKRLWKDLYSNPKSLTLFSRSWETLEEF